MLYIEDLKSIKLLPRSNWWKFKRWLVGLFGKKVPNNVNLPGESFKIEMIFQKDGDGNGL